MPVLFKKRFLKKFFSRILSRLKKNPSTSPHCCSIIILQALGTSYLAPPLSKEKMRRKAFDTFVECAVTFVKEYIALQTIDLQPQVLKLFQLISPFLVPFQFLSDYIALSTLLVDNLLGNGGACLVVYRYQLEESKSKYTA